MLDAFLHSIGRSSLNGIGVLWKKEKPFGKKSSIEVWGGRKGCCTQEVRKGCGVRFWKKKGNLRRDFFE